MKRIPPLFIFIFLLSASYAQETHYIIDASTKLPIQSANVVVLKYTRGVSTNAKGAVKFSDNLIADADTIALTHINYNNILIPYGQFKNTDTFYLVPKVNNLEQVVVTSVADLKQYKRKNRLGFFDNKVQGGISGHGLRTGNQIGLYIQNIKGVKGIMSNIRLHFESLVPGATFRLRLKTINTDGTIGDDLVKNGIVITPRNKRPNISIDSFRIFFPAAGVFVCLDHLGDGKTYQQPLDEPTSVIKLTQGHSLPLTYDNYLETGWKLWDLTFRGKTANAQIQLTVLSKK